MSWRRLLVGALASARGGPKKQAHSVGDDSLLQTTKSSSRQGKVKRDLAKYGEVWLGRHGSVRSGSARYGRRGKARLVSARPGVVRFGMAGEVRRGGARPSKARHGRPDTTR